MYVWMDVWMDGCSMCVLGMGICNKHCNSVNIAIQSSDSLVVILLGSALGFGFYGSAYIILMNTAEHNIT